MSELTPSLVPLDKGLNLQTAKLVAPPGSVLDTLNYEQVDFQGQKRIDGFTRYDGSALAIINDYHIITVTTPGGVAAGDYVRTEDDLLGMVVNVAGDVLHVAIMNEKAIPSVGDVLSYFHDTPTTTSLGAITAIMRGVDSVITPDAHYANLLAYSNVMRQVVEELPGAIIGLHWFRDRLYAVADVAVVSLEGTSPAIYPNDTLTLGGQDAKVLDSYVRDNTRLLFLNTLTPAPWQVEGAAVTRNGDAMGTVANGFEEVLSSEEMASFFESRDEFQVLEEDADAAAYDYGWRFVDQGWLINFEDGLSLFGSLPSLNQNITGLGVQGPTSVSGNNGVPLILTQKVVITNGEAQVNGWKSSQTPLTYELETDNLIDIDDDTIYADAYVSWNGATTEVVGVTSPLVEYPATNTVVVEIT